MTAKVHAVDEHLVIGPQPGPIDFDQLVAHGVKKVINFRTPDEMKKLDYDEAAILAGLGIGYEQIPIGGKDFPYTPLTLKALDQSLDAEAGKVLLHCASGRRASVLAVAWLVEENGMPINEALRHAQGWWPLSLEEVLGRRYQLIEAE